MEALRSTSLNWLLPRNVPLLGGSFISQFEKEGLISTLLSRRQADLTKALSSSNKCAKSGRWYRIIRARLLFARSFTLAFGGRVLIF